MSFFWSMWTAGLTLICLGVMFGIVFYFWRTNDQADENKYLESFDGVDEVDGPAPQVMFYAYLGGAIFAVIFFILYPGLGNWSGILDWKSHDAAVEEHDISLKQQIENFVEKSDGSMTLTSLSRDEAIVNSGHRLFQTHCAACHGREAEGKKHFPSLVDDDWIYGKDDGQLLYTLINGRHGVMAGWGNVLSEEDIDSVSSYVTSLQRGREIGIPQSVLTEGRDVFVKNCVVCHGSDGKGQFAKQGFHIDLTDDIWLHGGSFDDIKHTVTFGLSNRMPAFDHLKQEEIFALGAYVRNANEQNLARLESLDPVLIEKGRYLARAGDCIACHTSEKGEPLAGGLPFKLPIGTIYSVNITPHPIHGIGKYDYQDFHNALHKGIGKHGFIYPAMPYTSYINITDEDTKALWAYMQSLAPSPELNPDNTLLFYFNLSRLGQFGWNLFFLNDTPLEYPADKSDKWKRGKYLAETFGHCQECHTPRNLAQALIYDQPYRGNFIDGWMAPGINAQELYEDGWEIKSLTDFLYTGHSEKGNAFGGMAEVVKDSMRHISRDDVEAIATYLIEGDKYNELDRSLPRLAPTGFTEQAKQLPAYKNWANICAACHGLDGKGRENIAPALYKEGIIMHSHHYDTVAVVIRGLHPNYIDPKSNYMPMSAIEPVLSDKEIADLVSFVRLYLGGRDVPVTQEQVTEIRLRLQKDGYLSNIHPVETR